LKQVTNRIIENTSLMQQDNASSWCFQLSLYDARNHETEIYEQEYEACGKVSLLGTVRQNVAQY